MPFQWDGSYFSQFFHLVNDKGNQGEVKPSGGRVKTESQFNLVLDANVKLELVQIDSNRPSDLLRHEEPPDSKAFYTHSTYWKERVYRIL